MDFLKFIHISRIFVYIFKGIDNYFYIRFYVKRDHTRFRELCWFSNRDDPRFKASSDAISATDVQRCSLILAAWWTFSLVRLNLRFRFIEVSYRGGFNKGFDFFFGGGWDGCDWILGLSPPDHLLWCIFMVVMVFIYIYYYGVIIWLWKIRKARLFITGSLVTLV